MAVLHQKTAIHGKTGWFKTRNDAKVPRSQRTSPAATVPFTCRVCLCICMHPVPTAAASPKISQAPNDGWSRISGALASFLIPRRIFSIFAAQIAVAPSDSSRATTTSPIEPNKAAPRTREGRMRIAVSYLHCIVHLPTYRPTYLRTKPRGPASTYLPAYLPVRHPPRPSDQRLPACLSAFPRSTPACCVNQSHFPYETPS
ncbi:hypothetical protein LX32DRAFT_100453 [Colletotrichum zoysiae]|uniref:Uncharacterized protein n=1 Tax=Colletotrichum zoysiae TaxID=1216348 RepID=A0AAD9M0A3_9PEZI|nr:hypothetical protein LX32DRAFT_100453 [Colletotrichum zoysiae]